MKRCQCWKSEQWSQLWGVLGKAHLSGRKWGLSLLQHWHSSIFQQLYTHLSTPWGCSHHEIQDEGCSISNGKSYCDFNWISAAILFFFPRAPPLSISSLLPVIQQFIPHYTNPSIRQFLIPFMQWLWQQLPVSLVFGALPFFIKQEFISDTLWLSGSSTFPAMRSIMSLHNVLAHFILHLSWRQHCGHLKKWDRKMEIWSPEDQKQAMTPGTQTSCDMFFRISGKSIFAIYRGLHKAASRLFELLT